MAEEGAAETPSLAKQYLVLANIGKKDNIKKLLVSAFAFGVEAVIVIGMPNLDLDAICSQMHSEQQLKFVRFESLQLARDHLKSIGASIAGIEIMHGAEDVNTNPFRGDTAFLLGNEGQGLSEKQLSICDQLIYIPQYGGGTASLNVCVAGSILLQKFAVWCRQSPAEQAAASAVETAEAK